MMRNPLPLLALALAPACGADPARDGARPAAGAPAPRPNVVLVTFDTLRADRCSAYGHERETTPALDALAAEGVLFEAAYAVMPTTGPSHATLFTSLWPDEHGVLANGERLAEGVATLADVLGAAGWETAGFASSFVMNARFGLDRGFAHYDDDFAGAVSSTREREELNRSEEVEGAFDRKAESTNERALAWLSGRDRGRPFFLWVHYFDPHKPYAPPPEFVKALADGPLPGGAELQLLLYDAETRYADHHLARLVEAARAVEGEHGTLVVVTADHGEGLGDHGWGGHGVYLYEEAVRVPLVVAWPGRIPGGRRVERPVGLVDLFPTLVGLLALEPELELRGADLTALLTAPRPPADAGPPVFLQRRFYAGAEDRFEGRAVEVRGPKWAVREGRWKLIAAPEEGRLELYDLEADPGELSDLAAAHPDVVERLSARLASWKRAQVSRRADAAASEQDRAALESLGYVE